MLSIKCGRGNNLPIAISQGMAIFVNIKIMEYKTIIGWIAVIIGFVSYLPYYRNIFRNKTKPHAFSWFIFAILSFIGFAAQKIEGAGAGAWVTGISGIMCIGVFVIALYKGTKNFAFIDKIFLALALITLIPWWLTKDPLISVVLISLIDIFGFIPTIRHGYMYPYEETLSTFILSSIKFILGIIALKIYTLSTFLYPASIAITTSIFCIILILKRFHSKSFSV